jgi:hypothetical protein
LLPGGRAPQPVVDRPSQEAIRKLLCKDKVNISRIQLADGGKKMLRRLPKVGTAR